MIDTSPGGCEVVSEGVLGVAAASVDGDVLMVSRAAQRPDQRPGVALINDDVNMPSTTLTEV